ncbi:uncharacterized protein LOC116195425 [Punica granatum]|uniref:Uncharacterized protein n=2 Tax=Punica granatum TaxID=22663 RepID=A0A218XZF0_PUNGR|nr:uncharacterized protein LOC116195425 [Punica granatum]OWM89911.1 hypothetical protein CDL15_Pgr012548 [Punica granatum]PKI50784.1 hypothetical protein CRG98_028779 [Punica granatum]
MKGSSQVIMGATLIMAASLAIVVGLVLVLFAELYCSLLLRRRRSSRQQLCSNPAASSATAISATPVTIPSPSSFNPSDPSPLSSFYAQGVLHAPRSLLFPALPSPDAAKRQYRHSEDDLESNSAASPPPKFITCSSLPGGNIQEDCSFQVGPARSTSSHLVYISNPIYDNDATDRAKNQSPNTPFETPDSSPSHLECGTSSGADDECDDEDRTARTGREPNTPPLTPMKKLPAQACSVPLRDAGSLCTSGTDSNTNRGLLWSSSSGTPCTSPSW